MSGGSDTYLYPGTDALRNVPRLRDPGQLATFETIDTARRTHGSAESARGISSQGSQSLGAAGTLNEPPSRRNGFTMPNVAGWVYTAPSGNQNGGIPTRGVRCI